VSVKWLFGVDGLIALDGEQGTMAAKPEFPISFLARAWIIDRDDFFFRFGIFGISHVFSGIWWHFDVPTRAIAS
jgi:hypothetical protein